MEVWTEYEGRTIDGAFPLTRLLRPEGSSAFFTTSNEAGLPRLIRLIESRSDEEDILSRWRGVAALDHPNILKLEEYGQVVIDETSLVYAVMEPVDANLGEVVRDQCLTLPETRQIAASLSSVLAALHAHGFVHQHVEPVNVVAVGEVVKLQCDCICEAPEGKRGRQLKQRDVHDLAVVLLQALTQEQTLEAATEPSPSARAIRSDCDQGNERGMGTDADCRRARRNFDVPGHALPQPFHPMRALPRGRIALRQSRRKRSNRTCSRQPHFQIRLRFRRPMKFRRTVKKLKWTDSLHFQRSMKFRRKVKKLNWKNCNHRSGRWLLLPPD